MLYKCDRCNKEFNQKSNYNYHINRKNPCNNINNIESSNNIIETITVQIPTQIPQNTTQIPQNTAQISDQNTNLFVCVFCNKKFTRKDILTRHKNHHCKENKVMIKLKKLEERNVKLEERNVKLEEKINILEQENELLKNQIILPKSNIIIQNQSNIQNLTNITQNNIQTNNIIINFGDEDMSKLTENEILTALKSLSNCFQNLVKVIHLNSRLPEYNNILINNMRTSYGFIIKNNKFITKDKNKIIADLITIRVDDLESLSIDYKNKLCSKELSFIKDIIEFLRTAYIETEDVDGNIIKGEKTSAKKLKEIYNQLLFMLYDNKDIIKQKLIN
jgi:DNA-directed RNA polymerase subunit RPC12/RpoP